MTELTEKALIEKCKKNDRNAFNTLVQTYQSKIINLAYGMLSNQEDACDAAQEVFIRVYRGIQSFEQKASFSTWIYRITVNVCNDMLRKRTRTAPTVSIYQDSDEEHIINLPDSSPTPSERIEITETQLLVKNALNELSDEYRTVITLYDLEGLSYDEISSVLQCPIGTIKSRLNRARKMLKKKLSENRELFLK